MIASRRNPAVVSWLIALAAYTATMPALAADEANGIVTKAPSAATATDPVFECYRVHSAWGFGMDGALIDSGGAIFRYSAEKDPRPDFPDAAGKNYWPSEVLRGRLTELPRTGSVDAGKLAENAALIAKAAEGSITRSDTGVRDAGSSTCHAYVFEPVQQRFRDVMLGSDNAVADFRLTNSTPEAKQLIEWLKTVGVAN